jgi:D-aminopeptidase
MNKILAAVAALLMAAAALAQNTTSGAWSRASDLGLKVGILPTGPVDAITDVAGVAVGGGSPQLHLSSNDNDRTRTHGQGTAD